MLGQHEAYCTGCGKPRPILERTIDERYPIVACGRVKRPGTYDKAAARRVIKDRRARRKAAKALNERVLGKSPNPDHVKATRAVVR